MRLADKVRDGVSLAHLSGDEVLVESDGKTKLCRHGETGSSIRTWVLAEARAREERELAEYAAVTTRYSKEKYSHRGLRKVCARCSHELLSMWVFGHVARACPTHVSFSPSPPPLPPTKGEYNSQRDDQNSSFRSS